VETPEISVIVATRNRVDALRSLLPRLLTLSPGLAWELVVADNGSTDATAELLAGAKGRLRTVSEPRPGKSRALNTALAAARGNLLVFTDDDIEPHAAWLDELAAAARRHPDVDCFGGRIRIDPAGVPPWVLRSRLNQLLTSAHDLGDAEVPYPPNRFPLGPNMAVRRRALRALPEPWPVDLGPGSGVPVGDETAFFYRLGLGAGKTRIYVPSAEVRHEPNLAYLALRPALRRSYLGGYSIGLMAARYPQQAAPEFRGVPVWRKVAATHSWQEFCCSAVRVLGYAMGFRTAMRERAHPLRAPDAAR
jgi:glycosyltransferase involved in cell wall biosynthesis